MEASTGTTHLPPRWSVKLFGMAFTGLQPSTLRDTVELVKTCRAGKFHTKQTHTPMQTLQMIPPSWSFIVWGLDILGLFLLAVGGYRYLYVTINKFSKWPKATPVVKINK
jgi:hypothetical protein